MSELAVNLAHESIAPSEMWGAWNLDPFVILALAAATAFYLRGVGRLWSRARGRGINRRQASAFVIGVLVVTLALVSPLDALGETLFAAHMVQHLTLILVAAPLFVYARPLTATMPALPRPVRRTVRAVQKAAPARVLARGLNAPVTAWIIHVAALWTWHLPALYRSALENRAVHAGEHLAFVVTALLFWGVVIHRNKRAEPRYGGAILFVFTTALQSAALGVILLFAPTPLYPVHAAGASSWGLTPLEDQQIAGATMWIPAGMVYFGTIVVLFFRWMREMDARMRRKDARDRALAVGARN